VWKVAVVLSVVAFLLGAALAVVPLVPVPSGDRTVGEGAYAYFQVHSLLLDQVLAISWTASPATTLWVEDCGGAEPTGSGLDPCPSPTTLSVGPNGTSGTMMLTAPGGDWIAVGTGGGNATISLKTSDAQAALGAGAVGAFLLFLALRTLRRDRQAKRKAPPERTPTEAGAPTEAPKPKDDSPVQPAAPSTAGPAVGTDEGTR
jgi:hypothetical protein